MNKLVAFLLFVLADLLFSWGSSFFFDKTLFQIILPTLVIGKVYGIIITMVYATYIYKHD